MPAPSIRYRIMAALYGKRRPRSVSEIVDFLNTESPGPYVSRNKVHANLRFMALAKWIRWVEERGGYLRNRSKYSRNVGKPWTTADNRLLNECISRNTPVRIIALKLGRFEEEVIRKRPTYGSRKK